MSNTNDKYCVYVHRNKINGKIYVGQTCQKPESRWANGNGYKESPYFYNAIQKYGWNNFEHKVVLSNLDIDDANDFEQLLIAKLDTMNRDKGYNLRSGGKNSKLSESVKEKISKNHADFRGKNHPNYGKHLSEQARQKISISNKNPSDKTRKQMSESAKIRHMNSGNPFLGKHHTKEAKEKISQSRMGVWIGAKNPTSKKVIQYDKQGNFIKAWDYMTQASKELNVDVSSITKCCKNKLKTAGGFVWKYADTE